MMRFFMRKKPVLTVEQCNGVLERLRSKDLPVAEKRLADAQAAYDAGYLQALAKGDDVAVRRLEKGVRAATEDLEKAYRDIKAAEAELERISAEMAEREEEARRIQVRDLALQYRDELASIRDHMPLLAKSVVRLQQIREKLFELSGGRARFGPGSSPVFQQEAVNNLILEKLWGLSDGILGKPASACSKDEARESPSLTDRFDREFETFEEELNSQPQPPGAA
jgi:hypothetical protein